MTLPIGVSYLLRLIPHLLYPSVIVYVFWHTIQGVLQTEIPHFIVLWSTIIARPLLTTVVKRYTYSQHTKEAERLGAKLAPHLPINQVSVLFQIIQDIKNGFPGKYLLLIAHVEILSLFNR